MAFLTPEQILGIRKKGSKLISLDSMDGKQIRVIKMSSTAQLESEALQLEVKAGKATPADFLKFMLKSACADMDGVLLTEQDAAELFNILPLEDVTVLVHAISGLINSAVDKLKTNPQLWAEATPAEKKEEPS